MIRVPPSVAIIILNWNKFDVTYECLMSLRTLRYPNFRIYLVDNGSTEQRDIAELANVIPKMTLIFNNENLGYAKANNCIMSKAFIDGADYVWLFNNDAKTEPDTLDHLVSVAEVDTKIGMVSPLLFRRPDSDEMEVAAAIFDNGNLSVSVTQSIETAQTWQRKRPHNIVLYGTALLIKRSVYDAIGGFDEIFFAYCEDIDISIRSINAGFKNIVDFGARVFHRERPRAEMNTVAPYIYYYVTRNNIILWNKYGGFRARLKVSLWELDRRLFMISSQHLMMRNPLVVDAMLRGLWDGWWLRGGAYVPDRRMPNPLRAFLVWKPALWVRTLQRLTNTPI